MFLIFLYKIREVYIFTQDLYANSSMYNSIWIRIYCLEVEFKVS